MIRILTTPLSFRISVSTQGQLIGTYIHLVNYLKKFNQTAWDHQLKRMVLLKRFVHYSRKTGLLYLPRYDLDSFCYFLKSEGVEYQIEELPLSVGKDVTINLLPHVRDKNERQTKAINHLTNSTDHLRGLSLGTGVGKTFCTIRTIINIGKRAMISVVGLVDQWEKALYQFTDLTPSDVYIIQGAPSLMKLLLQIDKTIFPKVIMCSLGTIRNYVLDSDTYENCPPFDELMDRLGVGVRVEDEAHLNFWLSLMIDLRTNCPINIALTATFERTDSQVKHIFNNHYPPSIRYGEDEYSQYIDVYSYSYTLGGQLLPMKAYSTPKGYNHSKLEEYLQRRTPTKLEYIYAMVYSPIIFSHYVNIRKPGQKLLILCSTVNMCKWFKIRLGQDLPSQEHFKINIYVSETSDSVLDESDIIISTPASAGTGIDIKNLLAMLQTVATGSPVLTKQTLGRLRELPNGDTPIYAYAWCRDILPHRNYQESRKFIYTQRGKSFTEINL